MGSQPRRQAIYFHAARRQLARRHPRNRRRRGVHLRPHRPTRRNPQQDRGIATLLRARNSASRGRHNCGSPFEIPCGDLPHQHSRRLFQDLPRKFGQGPIPGGRQLLPREHRRFRPLEAGELGPRHRKNLRTEHRLLQTQPSLLRRFEV